MRAGGTFPALPSLWLYLSSWVKRGIFSPFDFLVFRLENHMGSLLAYSFLFIAEVLMELWIFVVRVLLLFITRVHSSLRAWVWVSFAPHAGQFWLL